MLYIGQGFDSHKFSNIKGLNLGLELFQDDFSFEADSDGDIIVHSICDAILSALKLGDIGSFIGIGVQISGLEILQKLAKVIIKHNASINNISITYIGEKPKLSPVRNKIEDNISKVFNNCQVSLNATTTDHLGFCGRGEGAVAITSILIEK